MITVIAKADAGHHPKYGLIVQGQTYQIEEADFGEELFERPEGWIPPWERTSISSDRTVAQSRRRK